MKRACRSWGLRSSLFIFFCSRVQVYYFLYFGNAWTCVDLLCDVYLAWSPPSTSVPTRVLELPSKSNWANSGPGSLENTSPHMRRTTVYVGVKSGYCCFFKRKAISLLYPTWCWARREEVLLTCLLWTSCTSDIAWILIINYRKPREQERKCLLGEVTSHDDENQRLNN